MLSLDQKEMEVKLDTFNWNFKVGDKILRVKNYSLRQMLKLLQEFELLEPKDSPIYNNLEKATYFRNRIHIYNWFNNFEKDEKYVFTDRRLEILEKLVIYILT